MEPLALALAAFGALGASALPALLVVRRRSAALLERLLSTHSVRPRTDGARVSVEAVTAFGAVRVDVSAGVLGNRWRLTAPLPGYRAGERAQLYPRLEQSASGALGEVRLHLSRAAQLDWSISSCAVASSTLSLVAVDRGVASSALLERRFEAFASLASLLTRARGSGGVERFACPSCRMVFLDPPSGALSDRECARCGGRLLDREALQLVVLDPLGKTPGDLSEAARGARGDGAICPSCARAMSPVLLEEDVIVDLCVGCGSTWLDEGELARLSHGRYGG